MNDDDKPLIITIALDEWLTLNTRLTAAEELTAGLRRVLAAYDALPVEALMSGKRDLLVMERQRSNALQAHTGTLVEQRAKLVAVIQRCEQQFQFYVDQHLAKEPPDEAKARTNMAFVAICRDVLATVEGAR